MYTRSIMRPRNVSPSINVTPLIDVLLVLLIIFMVVSPLKPSRFTAMIPEPPRERVDPNITTLVVTINRDLSLQLNSVGNLGTTSDTTAVADELARVFEARKQNGVYADSLELRTDLPLEARVERTVFIKAPRSLNYGDVVKVIDGIKGAGAAPIGLQVDDLEQ